LPYPAIGLEFHQGEPFAGYNQTFDRRHQNTGIMTEYSSPTSATAPSTRQVVSLIVRAAPKVHPDISVFTLKRRIFFAFKAFRCRGLLKTFAARLAQADPTGTITAGPDMIAVTEWPYLNNAWTVEDRLDRIARHYELLVSSSPKLLVVDKGNPLDLFDLSKYSNKCKIVIDQAPWFKREGELVLNLFREDLRVASIAFIFGVHEGAPSIFIGAIQGIHSGVSSEQSLLIYKNLTKDFEGLRPRSLLLDILRTLGITVGMTRLFAISDENRHHRHKYFGAAGLSKLATTYDQIWIEHGGVPSSVPGFFEIPLHAVRRTPDEIPSKKRSMYKRRYEILDEIEKEVASRIR
jgi:uncharacterized protein VirK/YbjX